MNHAGLETSEERTLKKIDPSQVKKKEKEKVLEKKSNRK